MKSILSILVVTFMSCGPNNNPEAINDSATSSRKVPENDPFDSTLHRNNDSTVYVKLLPDSSATTITANLHKNSPVNFYVDVQSGKRLKANLRLITPNLNARINQVFTPSGKADGPFGNQLDYSISENGMYKIVVSRNLMSEGAATGKFALRIEVE